MKIKTLLALSFASLLSHSAYASDWVFKVEPYAFFSNITGTMGIGGIEEFPVELDFSTIYNNLDSTLMLRFEAIHQNKWGIAMDYSFMDLSKKLTDQNNGFVKIKQHQGVLETIGYYRVNYGKTDIDYFTGFRWWDNDLDLILAPAFTENSVDIKISEDWIDIIAGVRVSYELNKDWDFFARADVGGFGLSADFTSTLLAGISYQISSLMNINLQYKGTWVDYDNDEKVISKDYFAYDTLTHGTVIGLNFTF